jgi:hypothetical protein
MVTTGGWVNTADTGQLDIATAAAPGAANTKIGYKIYRMDDALQASAPVFVRFDFGSSSVAAQPGMWVTIGQGSDGAGTITSIRYNGGAIAAPPIASAQSQSSGAHNSYGSAENNRVQFALFVTSAAIRLMIFSLERSRDANGDVTGAGLYMVTKDVNTILNHSRYIALGTTAQPPADSGVQYVLSSANPSGFNGNVGVGMPIPMATVAQPAALGLCVVMANDYVSESFIKVSIYGAQRTYVQTWNMTVAHGNTGGANVNNRCAIRYD